MQYKKVCLTVIWFATLRQYDVCLTIVHHLSGWYGQGSVCCGPADQQQCPREQADLAQAGPRQYQAGRAWGTFAHDAHESGFS